jgi:hypothetical protein
VNDRRYPAVLLSGNVYVATRTMRDPVTKRRIPVRHSDALTKAIYVVAATENLADWKAQKLIKDIDMGRVSFEFGSALQDGKDFQPIKP